MIKEYRKYRSYGHSPLWAASMAVPFWPVMGIAAIVGIILGLII